MGKNFLTRLAVIKNNLRDVYKEFLFTYRCADRNGGEVDLAHFSCALANLDMEIGFLNSFIETEEAHGKISSPT